MQATSEISVLADLPAAQGLRRTPITNGHWSTAVTRLVDPRAEPLPCTGQPGPDNSYVGQMDIPNPANQASSQDQPSLRALAVAQCVRRALAACNSSPCCRARLLAQVTDIVDRRPRLEACT